MQKSSSAHVRLTLAVINLVLSNWKQLFSSTTTEPVFAKQSPMFLSAIYFEMDNHLQPYKHFWTLILEKSLFLLSMSFTSENFCRSVLSLTINNFLDLYSYIFPNNYGSSIILIDHSTLQVFVSLTLPIYRLKNW